MRWPARPGLRSAARADGTAAPGRSHWTSAGSGGGWAAEKGVQGVREVASKASLGENARDGTKGRSD